MNYARKYKETQIETASPVRLIVILYDIIISSINESIVHLESRKYDLLNKELSRAQEGLIELICSLDFEKGGEIANNLYSIYLYCSRRLFEGNIDKDKNMLIEVVNILSKLRDAWEQIANMNVSTPQNKSEEVRVKSVDIRS
ncbi:MAG: flagellar export chaperone FliS [Brevinematia bacterium]